MFLSNSEAVGLFTGGFSSFSAVLGLDGGGALLCTAPDTTISTFFFPSGTIFVDASFGASALVISTTFKASSEASIAF